MPSLEIVAWIAIGLGLLTAIAIAIDEIRHPQKMRIMNVVWPITGLYFPVVGLWFYRAMGRPLAVNAPARSGERPRWKTVFVSATHCGSGCVLGDIVGAPIVFFFGLTALGSVLLAEYTAEFILAYVFGIAFQYLAIRSMRKVPTGEAIMDAVKADTLALVAFEVGMFGWMAIVYYLLLPRHPRPDTAVFWFMMQIGMVFGFLTTYPANWLLVKWGIKQGM